MNRSFSICEWAGSKLGLGGLPGGGLSDQLEMRLAWPAGGQLASIQAMRCPCSVEERMIELAKRGSTPGDDEG